MLRKTASMLLMLVLSSSAASAAQAAEEAGLVIFREKSFVGGGAKPLIRVNGEPLLQLRNGTFWMGRLPAGVYRLSAHDSDVFSDHDARASELEVTLAPAETVYVKARLAMGVRKSDTSLSLVTAEEGERASSRLALVRLKDLRAGALGSLAPAETGISPEKAESELQQLRVRMAKADIRSIATSVEAYAMDHDRYPVVNDQASLRARLQPEYIRDLPTTDPWGNSYIWLSDGRSYRVVSGGSDGRVADGVLTLGAIAPDAGDDVIYEDGEFIAPVE